MSPGSSCHSSDDEVTRGLKRMRISGDQASSRASSVESPQEYFHKQCGGDMVLVDMVAEKKRIEKARKAQMLKILQSQMRQFNSQYSAMSSNPNISECDGEY